jgi:hypothetical protein
VIRNETQWLSAAPWDAVLAVNKALCQAQKIEPLNNERGYDAARRLWEQSVPKTLPLQAAIDVCRDCYELGPFTFNNGNTFAAIGRTLIDETLKLMPPVEAQIVRTTVCHYIVGLIGRKELQAVMRHFDPLFSTIPAARRAVTELPPSASLPQERRASA